jgi:uncharacterized protein
MPAERTPPADDTLLSAPLLAITEWGLRAPKTVVAAACLLALVAVAITAGGLKFKSSRLDLLNPRSEYNQRWLAYLDEFGNRDDACLVVRAERQADLTAAIDALAGRLVREPQLFESVFFQRDLSQLKSKALHYLPGEQLERLQQQVALGAAMAGNQDPADALAQLNHRLSQVGTPGPEERARLESEYGRVVSTLLTVLEGRALGPNGQAGLPTSQLAALDKFNAQYLLDDNNTLGFVLTRLNEQAGEPAANATAIAGLRRIVREVQAEHRHVWIGLTGMPVIEHDEMAASQFDMLWTSVISMGLVLLLYLAAYGGLRHAMLVNLLLLLGTAYSFGFVTLAVGHLNILSAAFSAVLIGLGIDFSIHYVATYLNLRRQGRDEVSALLDMAVEVGPGVVTGGVTTAAAFFMAAMTDFVGIRELGLVAGGGILLCVLSTIVVLPPLILLVDRRWPLRTLPVILPAARWFQFPLRQPGYTMAVTLLVAGAIGAGSARLRYDHNLLNLQPRHLESADIERQLFTRLDDSVWFAVSLCSSPEEVRAKKAAFERLETVSKTEEIASLLPPHSADAARVQEICQRVALIPAGAPAAMNIDVMRLKQEIAKAQELLARIVPFETPTTALLGQARAALTATPPEQAAQRLSFAFVASTTQAVQSLTPLKGIANPQPPTLADVPAALRDRFVGRRGMFLLKVYARGNIWNMAQLETFVKAVEGIDPKVTGHPVQTYYASRHMQTSYIRAGLYALAAVLVLLWIDFRSLWHSLLAMVPPAVGFAMMCGCLGWLDIPFNPANMIVLPLILGIGVDHGVHLVHLWRQQRGRFVLGDATAVAVLLTASTTTASFGALIFARHQGLQSLGQAITLGVTTCLAASIILFPALLAWLRRGAIHEEHVSVTEVAVEAETAEPEAPEAAEAAPAIESPVETIALALEPATLPEPILSVLPVTDEEVAALLESALSRPLPQTATTYLEEADNGSSSLPRRRNLPRRIEAA